MKKDRQINRDEDHEFCIDRQTDRHREGQRKETKVET